MLTQGPSHLCPSLSWDHSPVTFCYTECLPTLPTTPPSLSYKKCLLGLQVILAWLLENRESFGRVARIAPRPPSWLPSGRGPWPSRLQGSFLLRPGAAPAWQNRARRLPTTGVAPGPAALPLPRHFQGPHQPFQTFPQAQLGTGVVQLARCVWHLPPTPHSFTPDH